MHVKQRRLNVNNELAKIMQKLYHHCSISLHPKLFASLISSNYSGPATNAGMDIIPTILGNMHDHTQTSKHIFIKKLSEKSRTKYNNNIFYVA